MKNCFQFGDKMICLPIYYKKRKIGPPVPDPDPRLILNPKELLEMNIHFSEIIKSGIINEKEIMQAATLGAIHELSKNLSTELKSNFEEALKTSIIKLNANTQLNLKY